MSNPAWKSFERVSAALFPAPRCWPNSVERVEFQGRIGPHAISGQCKLVKTLSLEALTKLAEEPGVDVVCIKVRRGSGIASPSLVVFTFEAYKRLHPEGS